MTAVINKGVATKHDFIWYQMAKGQWTTNMHVDENDPASPLIGFDFPSWVGDDNMNATGYMIPYTPDSTTQKVNSWRGIFLYDSPGVNLPIDSIYLQVEPEDRFSNMAMNFRDFVKFKTVLTDNGVFVRGEADVVPGITGALDQGQSAPVHEWSRNLMMHKHGIDWEIDQNN